VGRTPWSAADALVGFCGLRKKPARGPTADQGVRPTVTARPSRDTPANGSSYGAVLFKSLRSYSALPCQRGVDHALHVNDVAAAILIQVRRAGRQP